MNENTPKTSQQVFTHLWAVIKSANRIIPLVVSVSLILTYAVIMLGLIFGGIKILILMLIILITSIIVYMQTNNYGEAAIALSAGILAVYTVDWTNGNFVTFVMSWVAFTLITLIIASLRIATRHETILMDTVWAISNNKKEHETIKSKLSQITSLEEVQHLGPIERMEILRSFAYREFTYNAMKNGLKTVATLSILSGLDHKELAVFVSSVFHMYELVNDNSKDTQYEQLLNFVNDKMKTSVVSPAEFITAFNVSRYIALSTNTKPQKFFQIINSALEKGAKPQTIDDYITSYELI